VSTALQKTIALAANDYTPPASPEPGTETTAPATTMENLQSANNMRSSKSKLNAKLMALPPDVEEINGAKVGQGNLSKIHLLIS
jgi:hypothetical protein